MDNGPTFDRLTDGGLRSPGTEAKKVLKRLEKGPTHGCLERLSNFKTHWVNELSNIGRVSKLVMFHFKFQIGKPHVCLETHRFRLSRFSLKQRSMENQGGGLAMNFAMNGFRHLR